MLAETFLRPGGTYEDFNQFRQAIKQNASAEALPIIQTALPKLYHVHTQIKRCFKVWDEMWIKDDITKCSRFDPNFRSVTRAISEQAKLQKTLSLHLFFAVADAIAEIDENQSLQYFKAKYEPGQPTSDDYMRIWIWGSSWDLFDEGSASAILGLAKFRDVIVGEIAHHFVAHVLLLRKWVETYRSENLGLTNLSASTKSYYRDFDLYSITSTTLGAEFISNLPRKASQLRLIADQQTPDRVSDNSAASRSQRRRILSSSRSRVLKPTNGDGKSMSGLTDAADDSQAGEEDWPGYDFSE